MRNLLKRIKSKLRQNMLKVTLFSYALILGTSLPLMTSRCSVNCFNCGSCTLYLGIIPIITAVVLRNKFKHKWEQILLGFSRISKNRLRKGIE